MDVLRRNTDYGLRMMAALADSFHDGQLVSARQLATRGKFPYQIGCKILQRLHKAGLVKSAMGPKGGFILSRQPSQITLGSIVNVLQGHVRLNRCLIGGDGCEFQADCEINTKLTSLQLYIDGYLGGITLAEIVKSKKNS